MMSRRKGICLAGLGRSIYVGSYLNKVGGTYEAC